MRFFLFLVLPSLSFANHIHVQRVSFDEKGISEKIRISDIRSISHYVGRPSKSTFFIATPTFTVDSYEMAAVVKELSKSIAKSSDGEICLQVDSKKAILLLHKFPHILMSPQAVSPYYSAMGFSPLSKYHIRHIMRGLKRADVETIIRAFDSADLPIK